jgi:signal transduction histidine kinase
MWFLSRPTIRQKLTIVIALVSAMALGIFAAITIFEAARDARAELTNQALLLSEVGANALEAPVVFKDKKAALEMLAILGASEALVAADVHDAESKIFAERKFRRFTGPGIHEDHREMPKAVRFEYHHSTLHLGRPITSDGKIIGFLHLTFDLSNRFAALKTDAGIAILMAIGLLIVSMLLALAFGRVLTGPILKLTGTMREVAASNDFSHQLEVRSRDEVGELTHGFNSMLRGLAQHESELEEYREGLEELVEERTHELATTNTKLKGQIAQRERAETDLRKAKDLAEEASRAKSEFLANMSHEIRTPMNGVLGMTELLAKSPLDERQQQLVDTVRHSGQTLLRVINDILDFSRMGAEQFSLELADFDLHSAVEKTVDLFSEVARNKEIGLELHIQDAVPPAAIGDESRLRQVLGNIINNAIKFTLEGKVSVDVRAREKDGRSEVSFEVSDTGIGIAESDLNLIFDPFRQADGSTSRRFGGLRFHHSNPV